MIFIFNCFSELMDIIDIEKFFNENFFKKIPKGSNHEELAPKEEFMHGVPESGYEPTTNGNPGSNTNKERPNEEITTLVI